MLDYFSNQKKRIIPVLQAFIEQKKGDLSGRLPWAEDVLDRLSPFVANGKMLRGGLTVLAHDMYKGKTEDGALQTAAAIELLQAAFLIHDDIMDKDILRRGSRTIHHQYSEWGDRRDLKNSESFGEAMGICVGDAAFFLAFELLNELPFEVNKGRQNLLSITLREITKVGFGQMQDVYFGFVEREVSEDDILAVFRNKTAPYTFTLPLLSGASLAGRQEDDLSVLRQFGEIMGLIFQVRDDELGLFGAQEEIGKPVGADIKQGKKTLFHLYLSESLPEVDRSRLDKIFGNPEMDERDVAWVRSKVIETGVKERLERMVGEMAEKACVLVDQLPLPAESEHYRRVLRDIIDYSLQRSQ